MKWSPLQLKNLALLGPSKLAAYINFKPGLNVICGASDTGKSFIVETIDFLLGGSAPLRDIPERIGYDRGRFSITTEDEQIFTFERSVEGGEYQLFEGFLEIEEVGQDGIRIKSKHAQGKVDNLSGWLLSYVGLLDKQIRKNAQGITRSLSFRDLARLIIVQEHEIIKRESPFLTGQYVTKTSELSALKLLLTGVDDSALIAEPESSKAIGDASAKIELIEQWLEDLMPELEDLGTKREDMYEQLVRLDQAIDSERKKLEKSQTSLNQSMDLRRELYLEGEKIKNRISEIHELLDRFQLLNDHYKVDLERLAAIQESGSLFIYQDQATCPLCGAPPEHQHIDESCEGDVETVVLAANVEIDKIKVLSKELANTVSDLSEELGRLNEQAAEIELKYNKIDVIIRETISPDVGEVRTAFGELVDKRSEARKGLELFDRFDRLEKQKEELLKETDTSVITKASRTDLSKKVLDELAKKIEKILKAWNFPSADRVYFDENTFDFVIDGKPRGSRGKGLRAITHAGVTIGIMEYCKEKSLPHPGFVVLDSPLLSYWEPEGQEDSLIGMDLKDRFYEYLATEHSDCQVIIIENEHPPDKLLDTIALTDFTKNPHQGRYGFFPE